MNLSFAKNTLSSALKHRNLALWSCGALSVSNMVLAFMLLGREEHWVLMPQYDEEHRLEVTRSKYSDAYMMDWATGILNTLLCANPDSVDWKVSQILKISRSNYGNLREKLQTQAKKIRQDQVSTAFYPTSYVVNQTQRSVDVEGTHSAWFGRDTAPVITSKKFRLIWAVRGHGVVLLEDFRETGNEPQNP